ncbi:MAG TPA: hypothetical protein PKI17_05985 [Syntrophomonas sp.]|nr:hypothetical protein [Syntrophomonas sp.]
MGNDASCKFFSQVSNAKPGTLHFNMLLERMQKAARVATVKQAIVLPDITIEEIKPAKNVPVRPIAPSKESVRQKTERSVRIADNPYVEISKLPEALQEDYKRIKAIPRELAQAHGEMKAAKTDAERADKLQVCKDMERERKELWSKIDEWWEKNKEVQPTGTAIESTVDVSNIDKRLETIRKAINRAENELSSGNLDAKKKSARKIKLAAWKKEQKELLKQK